MDVNSTDRAKAVTEVDHRTFSYVKSLADDIFDKYRITLLVYWSHSHQDYAATFTARQMFPVPNQPEKVEFELYRGATREEALLGLLKKLETVVAMVVEDIG